ncbi:hypothetical protein [Nannocystis pusilla]
MRAPEVVASALAAVSVTPVGCWHALASNALTSTDPRPRAVSG